MSAAMKLDADLPPLPQLLPGAESAFTMRCLTDDALRDIQREAFQAGMLKASLTRFAPPQGELSALPELTDEQCLEFRRLPGDFNAMLRATYAAGAAAAIAQQREGWA